MSWNISYTMYHFEAELYIIRCFTIQLLFSSELLTSANINPMTHRDGSHTPGWGEPGPWRLWYHQVTVHRQEIRLFHFDCDYMIFSLFRFSVGTLQI